MRRRFGSIRFVALVLSLSLSPFGCKQGIGEHCQIDRDCKDDLECNQEGANFVCRDPSGNSGIDAGPDFDATPTTDAPPGVDAVPVDAAAIDAAAIDAPI